MLLTRQQEFLLEVLGRLGCARLRQLAVLVQRQFSLGSPETAERVVRAALRQLQYGNTGVCLEPDRAILGNKAPDNRFLDAIDVMLALSENVPLCFSAEQPPVLLRFAAEQKHVHAFAVVENRPSLLLPSFSPSEKVVLLLSRKDRPIQLPMENPQIFAIRQEDGSYRFFAPK